MPVYDYLCGRCGPFTEMKPMAEADLPHKCPTCRRKAPRAFLTAPYFATSGRGPPGSRASAERRQGRYPARTAAAVSGRSLRYNKQPTR